MSDLLTNVRMRDAGIGEFGRGLWGRLTREEAIRQARESARLEMESCQRFLAASDAEIEVKIVRGSHAQRLVEELTP